MAITWNRQWKYKARMGSFTVTHRGLIALVCLITSTPALAQDKLDYNLGGLKWRCETNCAGVAGRLTSIEQKGDVVTFGEAGTKVQGTAKTTIIKQSGPSLKCQMSPSFCGPSDKTERTIYNRRVEVPAWNCTVSVQAIDGETDTPPPFKPNWLRFGGQNCALGNSIWTSMSPTQVKAQRKKCGEWNVNC